MSFSIRIQGPAEWVLGGSRIETTEMLMAAKPGTTRAGL